jgi:hypothetical protein
LPARPRRGGEAMVRPALVMMELRRAIAERYCVSLL